MCVCFCVWACVLCFSICIFEVLRVCDCHCGVCRFVSVCEVFMAL